jgi:mucin-19
LSVSGTTGINTNVLTTSGTQGYSGAVTVANSPVLTGTNVTFSSTVNGAAALTVNASGATTFTGAVGTGTQLTSLTTDAAGTTLINGGSVSTSGVQTYNDNVTLGATATTLTASTATFNGTLAGGTNSLAVAGNAVFGDSGADTVNGLTTLSVSGTTGINTNVLTTSGAQTYTGAVTLANSPVLTGAGITFSNTVNGAANLTVTDSLTTIFGGAVGGSTALSSLTTDAAGTT